MLKKDGVFIIGEAGVNHNGSLENALRLVDIAAEAGVDAVKFQTFKAENIISSNAPKADYQIITTGDNETQLEMAKKLELSKAEHKTIITHCKKKNLQFLSTPFDFPSVDLLVNEFGLPCLKISSGEVTNAPLLLKAASTGKPIILSTGMSSLGEVETALAVLAFGYSAKRQQPSLQAFQEAYFSEKGQIALQDNVTLLHCTTEYPVPLNEVNLKAMDTLFHAFKLPVGLSDHTVGLVIPIAAAARGAKVIEKHFTIDKNLPGPDHKSSLEPEALASMVTMIRQVEKCIGSGLKMPAPCETKNKDIVRRSLVASNFIKKGTMLTQENIGMKRPGKGISPINYWTLIGQRAKRDYALDELLD